jgi:hypothetical protein
LTILHLTGRYKDGTTFDKIIEVETPEERINRAKGAYNKALESHLFNTTLVERALNCICRTVKLFLWDLPTSPEPSTGEVDNATLGNSNAEAP